MVEYYFFMDVFMAFFLESSQKSFENFFRSKSYESLTFFFRKIDFNRKKGRPVLREK